MIVQQALGIVKFIESRLMSDDFADVSWTLKNLALSDSDQDALSKAIKSIDIPVRSRASVVVRLCISVSIWAYSSEVLFDILLRLCGQL